MKRKYYLFASIIAIFIILITWENLTIGTTHHSISSDKIPKSFDGFKIVQISDLHNNVFGKDNEKLLEKIRHENPNIIFLTGDLIDSNHTDIDAALTFTEKIAKVAPCYFITGNHEAWIGTEEYKRMENTLIDQGIMVLHNSSTDIVQGGGMINLIGVDDPSFAGTDQYTDTSAVLGNLLQDIEKTENYSILLSHRPEAFDYNAYLGFDLVFSGHAHGGQFRLPFIGGIVAPNQGLFPKYDAGIFNADGTTMIVSRGLGNSILPIRINNQPELVSVTLHHK